ncbi:magnesium/cobalt transporter CorA [Sulfurimonas sp. HSL3-7]|uniref:magnesium/cobalt transporter CorA n=1 Tax=Sulfonitrofixus jiaomeiensis TaxID=3131938 RepID=UPI0031F968B1
MADSLSNLSEKSGMPPGTLVHVGDVLETESTISLVDYNTEHLVEKRIDSIDELIEYKEKETLTWVNIEGLSNVALIESVGQLFNIHPLVLEDILNAHHRPKFEEADDYLYIVLKSLSMEDGTFSVNYEQISILVFKNFLFTFKEKRNSLFLPLYKRLQNNKARLRSQGSDYLAYAVLDIIVDKNFALLDALDITTDALEDELLSNPTSQTLVRIQQLKRELIGVRKSISPLRELLTEIMRSDTPLIGKKTQIYFRDVHDHILHITDEIESYRDMLTGLLDIYISSVSNRMNEIMKVLTVFASIFIPLTFVTGVYGMNFQYMPELAWKWGYPAVWLFFILFTILSLVYFKKKRWV